MSSLLKKCTSTQPPPNKQRSTEHTVVHSRALIPTILESNPSHRPLVHRFYQILSSTKKITIVCGAGISTYAGIPDFRSENGLLNQTFGDQHQLKGSELFESATIRDHNKRRLFNQEMARLRKLCREVDLTSCHNLIAKLHDSGRLVRCYTQNIDGLQTRDRQDMNEVIFELHGTNVHLKCGRCKNRPAQPSSEFDEQLLAGGYALCPTCLNNPARMAGNSKNLRCSQPGELLPDILLNDEVTELWKNGKRIDQLAIQDTRCHVLLIIGTRLKPKGASSLVKAMASQIQHFGGTVVYVDWHTLAPSSWAKYINLHIQMDIEMWANGCLKELNSVGHIVKGLTTRTKAWVSAQVSALAKEAYPSWDSHGTGSFISEENHSQSASNTQVLQSKIERKKIGTPCENFGGPAEREVVMNPTRILVVIYHGSWATFDARVLGRKIVEECVARGQEYRLYVVNVSGKEEFAVPPDWSSYYLIVALISSHTQFVHSREPVNNNSGEIVQLLKQLSKFSSLIFKDSVWSLAVLICPDYNAVSEDGLEMLTSQLQKEGSYDGILVDVDLGRVRLGEWASLILELFRFNPTRGKDGARAILNQVTQSWMSTEDAFKNFNLLVLSKYLSPYLLLASPFDEKPLGKSLSRIEDVCLCVQPQLPLFNNSPTKRWLIGHNATDKHEIRTLTITATCSSCGSTWRLPCENYTGRVRYTAGRYCAELPLTKDVS